MGAMKHFLMDVMESMDKDELDEEVYERANEIFAKKIDDAIDKS